MASVTSCWPGSKSGARSRFAPDSGVRHAQFEAEFRASVEANGLDRIDMLGENGNGGVLRCLQSWAENRVWLTARR